DLTVGADTISVATGASIDTGGGDVDFTGTNVNFNGDVFTDGGKLTVDGENSINAGTTVSQNDPGNWLASHSYARGDQKSTSGSGTGMLVDIEVDALQNLTVNIVDPGSGYATGDTVTFADQQPSGIGQDLVLTLGNLGTATLSTRSLNASGTASDG